MIKTINCYKYTLKSSSFLKPKSITFIKRPVHLTIKKSNKIKFQTNSYMNDTIVTLNHFTNNDTWKLTAHAIVNFSAIFFTVNWLYYRSIRIKMEKKDKGDE